MYVVPLKVWLPVNSTLLAEAPEAGAVSLTVPDEPSALIVPPPVTKRLLPALLATATVPLVPVALILPWLLTVRSCPGSPLTATDEPLTVSEPLTVRLLVLRVTAPGVVVLPVVLMSPVLPAAVDRLKLFALTAPVVARLPPAETCN